MTYRRPAVTAWVFVLLLSCIAVAQDTAIRSRLIWSELPVLPQAMSGHFTGVVNDALVVAGGSYFEVSPWQGGEKIWLDRVFVLDRPDGTWSELTPLPHPLAYGGMASVAKGMVLAGGSDGKQNYATVFLLTRSDDGLAVQNLPDLPQPCAMTAAAVLGETVYVAGGQTAPDSTTAMHTFWSLDTSKDGGAWEELEPWPGPARILPVVAAQEGSVYVISGADLSAGPDGAMKRTYLNDGYRFTPGQGWKPISPAPKPLVAAESVAFGPSSVLVFSGDDGSLVDRNAELGDNHPGFPSDVWSYNTVTDTWAKVSEMPKAVVTTGAVTWQDRIVITGGEDRPGHRETKVQAAVADHTERKGMVAMDYS